MHLHMNNDPESFVGTIVYKTFDAKNLYIIESIDSVNQFDVTVNIKDADGKIEKISSLRLKCFNTLIEDHETKLKNHKARLWNFETKLGLNS